MDRCLDSLEPGNTLIVWRLDRLGQSMAHLIQLVKDLRQQGIGFKSKCDGAIDTTTASGELIFNIFSSMAQFKRRRIQERTRAGQTAAKARGKQGGRQSIPADDLKIRMAKRMHEDKSVEIEDICKTLHICKATLYRYLKTA